jgi:protocatechuate 3,4-dioxygenase beta subunit
MLLALWILQSPTQAQQANASARFGTIQGIVTKTGSGDPIAGAQISLGGGAAGAQAMQNLLRFAATQGLVIPSPPSGASDEQVMQSLVDVAMARGVPVSPADLQSALDQFGGVTFPTTSTDAAGRFTFANVAPGRYTLKVQHSGFFGVSINGPNLMAVVDATVVEDKTANVAISMTPAAIISGRVRNAAGQPMSNVAVEAYNVFYQDGIPFLDQVISRATDDQGEYRLFWVIPGQYYVGVTPRPASAAAIAARNPHDVPTFYPEATDPSAAIPLIVRAGEEVAGIDIGMRKVRPFHISGRVTSTVPPVPVSPAAQGAFAVINQLQNNSATIFITPRSVTSPDHIDLNSVATVVLDNSSGAFDIPNILPGSYTLYARVNDQKAPAFGRTEVDVQSQDVTGLTINIRSSVDVKGSVSVPGAASPSAWQVTVQPEGSIAKLGFGLRQGPVGARFSTIAKDGTFDVQGIPPGHYGMRISGLSPSMFVDDVRQNGTSVYDSGFDVGFDSPTPIQIIVKSGTGSIEGVAKPGAIVALTPTGRRNNHVLYYGVTADPMGAFTIRAVAPGDYKIFAWESIPPGAYLNADFLKKYEDAGSAVTVTPDSKLKINPTVIK